MMCSTDGVGAGKEREAGRVILLPSQEISGIRDETPSLVDEKDTG